MSPFINPFILGAWAFAVGAAIAASAGHYPAAVYLGLGVIILSAQIGALNPDGKGEGE